MVRFRLVVAYHGTAYAGFQRQANAKAVQNHLDPVLSMLFQHKIETVYSGRTDQGVHAHGQVLSFEAEMPKFALNKLPLIANRELPPDIRVLHVEEAEPTFHPRFLARVRQYRYRLVARRSGGAYAPGEHEHAWDTGIDLDPELIRAHLTPLLGAHDFTAFASVHDVSRTRMRELFQVDAWREGLVVSVDLWGNAFLRSMVRSLIGNLVQGLRHEKPVGWMAYLLESKNPLLAKARAPACGLSLRRVFYAKIFGDRAFYRPERAIPQGQGI